MLLSSIEIQNRVIPYTCNLSVIEPHLRRKVVNLHKTNYSITDLDQVILLLGHVYHHIDCDRMPPLGGLSLEDAPDSERSDMEGLLSAAIDALTRMKEQLG